MCGIFIVTPKTDPRTSRRECRQRNPPAQSHHVLTSTHARVDLIMGAPSSQRNHHGTHIRDESRDRRARLPSKIVVSNDRMYRGENMDSADQPYKYDQYQSRPRGFDQFKRDTCNLPSDNGFPTRPQTRPRIRRQYSPSPLVNVGESSLLTKSDSESTDFYQLSTALRPPSTTIRPTLPAPMLIFIHPTISKTTPTTHEVCQSILYSERKRTS